MASISSVLKNAEEHLNTTKIRYINQLASGLAIKQSETFERFADEIINTNRLFYVNSYLPSWSSKKSTSSYITALSALSTSCDLQVIIDAIGAEKAAALKARISDISSHIYKNSKTFFEEKLPTPAKTNKANSDSSGSVLDSLDSSDGETDVDDVTEPIRAPAQVVHQPVQVVTVPNSECLNSEQNKIVAVQQRSIEAYKFVIDTLMAYITEKDPPAAIALTKMMERVMP